MPTTTFASANVLRTNTPETIAGDVLKLMQLATVVGLCELLPGSDAARQVHGQAVKHGWLYTHPAGSENALLWEPREWRANQPNAGCHKVGPKGPHKLEPARQLIDFELTHTDDKSVHWFAQTHYVNGYAKTGADAPGDQDYRDQCARENTLHTLAITAHELLHGRASYHHLWGDLNAREGNHQHWWYPAAALPALWVPDTEPKSIDWMVHSRVAADKGLRATHREQLHTHSDHPAQLVTVSW